MAEQQIFTYVFTDLVGSTRLTRTLPAPAWRRLKDRHDELVRQSAATAGGQVVKALGDGFLVVFPAEEPAISFAIALQRAMGSEPWQDGTTPEIRIGMDTGPAIYRPNPPDFEGDAVNVASHVCARARPGEVLLSARAYYGARPWMDRAGSEVRLESVGEVRLKGLPTLEPLYRAWAPGLCDGYPPLVRTGNLAAHLGPPPFIGREELLSEVVTELRRRPVVTLLGPGGMGKTRLATEVGARVEAEFPAGVWVTPLESIRRGDAVAAEIMATLGVGADDRSTGSSLDPEAALLRHLADWHGLLILDNVEQLVEEGEGSFAHLLRTITRACTAVRLLCTSRVDLHVGASVEARIELPPLPAPASEASAAALRDCPSTQLCIERLRLRVRHFSLDDASAPHVAAICRATEGVPLLIELAAGQLGRRTLPEIARDVERSLVTPSRDTDRPDRHRDLIRLLEWSLALLGEERDFFLRLGVFHGGFEADAAAAVTDEPRAEEFLQRLVEAHLVCDPAADDYLAAHPRYRLLSAAAGCCRAMLGEELQQWRRRHAEHFAVVVRAAGSGMAGTAPGTALAELSRERENLIAAMDTALELNDLRLAATIGTPLWELLHRMGMWPLIRDGAERLAKAAEAETRALRASDVQTESLQSSGSHPLEVRAPELLNDLLFARGVAAMALARAAQDGGQVAAARDHYAAALAIWRELGEEGEAARALHGLGNTLRHQDPAAAEAAYGESLALAAARGDGPLRALNLTMLGAVASRRGRGDEAERHHVEAVNLFRGWDDPWGLAIAVNARAQNLERLGQPLRARDLYTESLEIKRELGDRRGTAMTLTSLGRLALTLGDSEAAHALLRESLAINREIRDAWGCAVTLGALAELWLAEGDAEAALEATASGLAALEELGGGGGAEAAHMESQARAARTRIPADRADACERRGRETAVLRHCDTLLARRDEARE